LSSSSTNCDIIGFSNTDISISYFLFDADPVFSLRSFLFSLLVASFINESIKANDIPTSNQTNGTVKRDNSTEEINYAFSRDSFIETCEQRNKNGKNDLISAATSNENKKDSKLKTG
jgi:hypothetical protein